MAPSLAPGNGHFMRRHTSIRRAVAVAVPVSRTIPSWPLLAALLAALAVVVAGIMR
jgi:hypothetical protein